MKSLVVLLLVLGVYSVCTDDEYRWFASCMPCEESTCGECQGTNKCKSCPAKMTSSNYGECDECEDHDYIPLNKVCVPCSDYGANGDNGMDCVCPMGDDECCTQDGVYKWGQEEPYGCSPCSFDMMGCTKCSYNRVERAFTCLECGEGYVKEGTGVKTLCLSTSYSGYLLTLIGILISLLITI